MPLYRKKYWDAVSGDKLPDGVDYAVFDLAINSGTGRAAKIYEKLVIRCSFGIIYAGRNSA